MHAQKLDKFISVATVILLIIVFMALIHKYTQLKTSIGCHNVRHMFKVNETYALIAYGNDEIRRCT